MSPRIVEARPMGGSSVWLRFEDGLEGTLELGEDLDGPGREALKDRRYFAGFRVEGTLRWPNGASFDAGELAARLRARRRSRSARKLLDLVKLGLAALLVFVALLTAVNLVDSFGAFERVPPVLTGLGLAAFLLWKIWGSFLSFGGDPPAGGRTQYESSVLAMEQAGELAPTELSAGRAFAFHEVDRDFPSYFLELTGGRVLYLDGPYLEYVGAGRPGFPSDAFTLRRDRADGGVVDVIPYGRALECEHLGPARGLDAVFGDELPEDGALLDRGYDDLFAAFADGAVPAARAAV